MSDEACKFSKEALETWAIDQLRTLEDSLPKPDYQGAAGVISANENPEISQFYRLQREDPTKKAA